jgi:hypothetical protein
MLRENVPHHLQTGGTLSNFVDVLVDINLILHSFCRLLPLHGQLDRHPNIACPLEFLMDT